MALRASLRLVASQVQAAAGTTSSATAAVISSSSTLKQFFSSSSSAQDAGNRGSTAGELGDKAAQKMSGAEGSAARKGRGVEDRAADMGFVPDEANAVPNPDAAGQAGGIGARAMGDVTDMVDAMFSGDKKRAGQDVADMARSPDGGAGGAQPARSTAAEWPSGIWREGKNIGHADKPMTSEGDVVDKYEGTIPGSSPPKSPPEIDQNPPENVTAGPASTGGYNTRGDDNRAI